MDISGTWRASAWIVYARTASVWTASDWIASPRTVSDRTAYCREKIDNLAFAYGDDDEIWWRWQWERLGLLSTKANLLSAAIITKLIFNFSNNSSNFWCFINYPLFFTVIFIDVMCYICDWFGYTKLVYNILMVVYSKWWVK